PPPPRPSLFPCTTLFRSPATSPPPPAPPGPSAPKSRPQKSTKIPKKKNLGHQCPLWINSLRPSAPTAVSFSPCPRGSLPSLPSVDRKSTRLNSSHVKISY